MRMHDFVLPWKVIKLRDELITLERVWMGSQTVVHRLTKRERTEAKSICRNEKIDLLVGQKIAIW